MNGLNLKLILEAVDRITAPVRNIKTKLVDMFKSATAGARALAEQMDKAGKKAAEVGGFMTGRFSLPILGIGALSIRSAGQVEELTMQMEHLAGGAEKAREFVKSLQGYIDKFGTEELSKSVQLLETAGYSIDDMRKRLSFLGDVAAGSRTPLSALTEQYIDLRKAGKVSDGDLTTMMKANIPIVAELAKQLGKTEKQVINMAANGKISFEQYRKAMEGMTEEGGRFYGAMERQGKSIFGMFKEMGFSLRNSLADLGFDLWKDLDIADKIKSITSAVRSLIEGFMGLPKWLKSSITWFVLILAVIGPVLMIIGQLTVGVAGLLFAFGKLPLLWIGVAKGAMMLWKGFNLLLTGIGLVSKIIPLLITGIRALGMAFITNPIGLFLTALALLGVAAYMLIKHWDKVKAFFGRLWSALPDSFKTGLKVAMALLAPFLFIPMMIVKNWSAITGFFSNLWGDLKAVFQDSIASVLEYLQPLIDAVNMVVGGLASIGRGVGDRLGSAWKHITGDDAPAAAGGAPLGSIAPAPRGARNSKLDAGGTLKITIDQNNQARVTEARSNDNRVKYQAPDTGSLLPARG